MYENLLKSALSENNTPIIVTISNWDYIEITLNWIAALKRLNIDSYLIVSLDRKLHEYLNENGLRNVLIETDNNHSDIWKIKLEISSQLANNNIDFIYSDVDAVWLKNPLYKYFHENCGYNIIFTMGTIHPSNIYKKWGFVLCAGMYYVKSCNATRELLASALDEFLITNDDQEALNNVLYKMDIKWEFESKRNIYVRGLKKGYIDKLIGTKIATSKEMIEGRCEDLVISVLPYDKFPRTYSKSFEPYILHPLTAKKATDKIRRFKELSIWFLES